MKKIIIACAAIVASIAHAAITHAVVPVSLSDIAKVIPATAAFDHRIDPVDHYIVRNASGDVIGIAFLTSAIPPSIKGYRAEIDALVGMNMAGAVTGVEIIAHREDPQYLGRVIEGGFLDAFRGRGADRGFDDIEAVSGATISSTALKCDIQSAAAEVRRLIIAPGIKSRKATTGGWLIHDAIPPAAMVLVLAMATVGIMMPQRRWLRYTVYVTSIAVIGFWLNAPITIASFVDLRNGTIPAHLPLVIILAYAMVIALIKGNCYCAYICPFGAIQEIASHAHLPACVPPERVARNASWLRWIILIVSVAAIAGGVTAFRSIEPFAGCFARPPDNAALIQAGIVVAAALFLRRPWCRFFCPTGAFLDLVGQAGRKIRRLLNR